MPPGVATRTVRGRLTDALCAASGTDEEGRLARTEALMLLVRIFVLAIGAASIAVSDVTQPAGAPVAASPQLAALVQLVLALFLLCLAPLVLRLPAPRAQLFGRVAVVADLACFAGYQAAFHDHPGTGSSYGLFILLEAACRWRWPAILFATVAVGAITVAWPQHDAGGHALSVLEVLFLLVLLTVPPALISAQVRRVSGRLRQAQAQFRTAFEHASLGMVLLGPDGRMIRVNHAFGALVGAAEENLVGTPFAEQVVGPQREPVSAALATLSAQQRGLRLEVELGHASGDPRWGLVAGSWLAGSAGLPEQILLQVENVTARRRAAAELARQANYDALTGLPNRALLQRRLEHALEQGRPLAVLFLDLDRFKVVNDGLGHAAGDELLVAVAGRLEAGVRTSDLVARLGGDEFVVLCQSARSEAEALALADRLLRALAEPFAMVGGMETVRASMGVAFACPDSTAGSLLRDADTAMYAAKAAGGARAVAFTPQMRAAAVRTHEMEVDLRRAVAAGGIQVAYQPIFDLRDGTVVGVEALARWTDPLWGEVSPAEFVRLAEQSDLINDLGAVVLTEALREVTSWGVERIQVSVNVATRQLADPEFPALVSAALARSGLAPERLCLEVTETGLAGDGPGLVEALRRLRGLGVRLAIDDFGTGHASLTYLAHFPVHCVKVDRSFVAGLGSDTGSSAIVSGVVAMAHGFGLTVVAEGIEGQAQRELLQALGCDHAQGYLLGRPVGGPACRAVVQANRQSVPAPRSALAEPRADAALPTA